MINNNIDSSERDLPMLSEIANLTVDLDKYPVNILICPTFTDELTLGDVKVTDIGLGSDMRILINAITDSELHSMRYKKFQISSVSLTITSSSWSY